MKERILHALAGELRSFLLPDGLVPERVELRVLYDSTMAVLPIPGEELRALVCAIGAEGKKEKEPR